MELCFSARSAALSKQDSEFYDDSFDDDDDDVTDEGTCVALYSFRGLFIVGLTI